MDDDFPATPHVLRPHHVGVLTIILLVFREFQSQNRHFPPMFMLHMYRVLLHQVSEVAQPQSLRDLINTLHEGPGARDLQPSTFLFAMTRVHQDLATVEQLSNFFASLPTLFVDKAEDDESFTPSILARRSVFGFYTRRCFVSFIKLNYTGVCKLHAAYMTWCDGFNQAGYDHVEKDGLLNATDHLIYKPEVDRFPWARSEPYDNFEVSQSVGDEFLASENLRRFFEQHFHQGNDSGYRQQALLNLARMHYIRHEYTAARQYLNEAIMISRTTTDKLTLQHCISLLHRIPPEDPDEHPMLSEAQPDLNPLEILFDIHKLMQPQNEQPLSASFERLMEGAGLYDHWVDVQRATGAENEQWGYHAAQSIAWKEAGCETLAAIQENIVAAFTETASDDNTRLSVLLNRTYKIARDGSYKQAIAMLLHPEVWQGLSIDDYVIWANQIWHIFMLEASRSGQERQCKEFLEPQRPPGNYDPKDYFLFTTSPATSMIRDRLHKAIRMRKQDQGTTAIKDLLEALWHTEFQGRFGLYRTAIILLADIGLEFGMTTWSKNILEEILPQLQMGSDREQRAFGYVSFARCVIASGGSDEEITKESLFYLRVAESEYVTLGMWSSVMDVRYILALVYNRLGMTRERDLAAKEHQQAAVTFQEKERVVVSSEVTQVLETIARVGFALSSKAVS